MRAISTTGRTLDFSSEPCTTRVEAGAGLGLTPAGREEGRIAVLLQPARLVESHDLERAAVGAGAAGAFAHADDAGRTDGDVVIGLLEGDRPGSAEHLIAALGDELAGGVDGERAGAGVAHPARRLHRDIALAVDGDVERVAGAFERARGKIDPGGAILDERDALVLAAEFAVFGAGHQIFGERGVVGLVAGGVDVGDVVGDDVELATERHLARQADEKGILHRYSPRSFGEPKRKLPLADRLPRAAGSPKPAAPKADCRSRASRRKFEISNGYAFLRGLAGGQKKPLFTFWPAKTSQSAYRPASIC